MRELSSVLTIKPTTRAIVVWWYAT